MKKFLTAMAAAAALTMAAPAAHAVLLDFDDLAGTEWFKNDADPYKGFRFGCSIDCGSGSWYHSDGNDGYAWYKSAFSTASTMYDCVLADGGGCAKDDDGNAIPSYLETESLPITRADLGDFVFMGAWFRGGYGSDTDPDDPPLELTLVMYKDGSKVCSSPTYELSWSEASTYLASTCGFAVDEVRVRSIQGFFAMDDFTANVPEPTSLALLLAGAVGAGVGARRRQAVAA